MGQVQSGCFDNAAYGNGGSVALPWEQKFYDPFISKDIYLKEMPRDLHV